MFPLAHAWLLTRIEAEPGAAHVLGCVWPDMLFASPLSHQQSHRSGQTLAAYVEAMSAGDDDVEVLRAFVAGVLTHGTEPHGFDWYSDEEYDERPATERGYAFQRGRALAEDAAAACDVAEHHGWWKAHNLIEMAFERPLYLQRPELGERLSAACADEGVIARIAQHLSRVFGEPAEALAEPMRRFGEVVQLRPATVESLAEVYALQVRLKHAGAQPDVAAIARLIGRAEELVAVDGQAYREECAGHVAAMLRAARMI